MKYVDFFSELFSRLAILDVIRENFYLLYKIVTKGLLFL